jgi:predicted dienelactone hydrolase
MIPNGHRLTRTVGVVALPLVIGVMAVAGCGGGNDTVVSGNGVSPSTATATVPPPGAVSFSGRGPYATGWVTLDLNGMAVEVFYPASSGTSAEPAPITSRSSVTAYPEALRPVIEQAAPFLAFDLPVELYPTAAAADDGPFPVLLYSHGSDSHPAFSVGHLAHTASWGFVVAAPIHPGRDVARAVSRPGPGGTVDDGPAEGSDRDDLRATWAELRRRAGIPTDAMGAAIDTARLAVAGHGRGGEAALMVGVDGNLDGTPVATVIGQAPSGPVSTDPTPDGGSTDPTPNGGSTVDDSVRAIPALLIAGERDGVVGLITVNRTFGQLRDPRQLVVVANAGHNLFLDSCAPVRARGGLLTRAGAIVNFLGADAERRLTLGEDGCLDGYLDPDAAMSLSRHLNVAQLRWAFGIDPDHAALDAPFLTATFGSAVGPVEYAP